MMRNFSIDLFRDMREMPAYGSLNFKLASMQLPHNGLRGVCLTYRIGFAPQEPKGDTFYLSVREARALAEALLLIAGDKS